MGTGAAEVVFSAGSFRQFLLSVALLALVSILVGLMSLPSAADFS